MAGPKNHRIVAFMPTRGPPAARAAGGARIRTPIMGSAICENQIKESMMENSMYPAPSRALSAKRRELAPGPAAAFTAYETGRAHVLTPATNDHLVCCPLLARKKN